MYNENHERFILVLGTLKVEAAGMVDPLCVQTFDHASLNILR